MFTMAWDAQAKKILQYDEDNPMECICSKKLYKTQFLWTIQLWTEIGTYRTRFDLESNNFWTWLYITTTYLSYFNVGPIKRTERDCRAEENENMTNYSGLKVMKIKIHNFKS